MRPTAADELGLLAKVTIFEGLSTEALTELLAVSRRREFRPKERIYARGDRAHEMCVVLSGLVKLSLTSEWSGRELSIPLVHPGQIFGELPMFDGKPRSLDAIAIEKTVLRMVEREEFLAFIRRYPDVAIHLLVDFATRIRRDTDMMEESTFMDVPGRLARVIVREAALQSDGSLATVPLTQTQLAELVGTTRETLNKELNGLKKLGLIAVEDQRVVVLNREALERRAM